MDNQKIRRMLLPSAGWILGIWLGLRFLGPVLLPFGLGLLAALAAEPIVAGLQRQTGLPRWAAAGLGVAGVYLLLVLLLAVLFRLLWKELTAFLQSLPHVLAVLSAQLTLWEQKLTALSSRFPAGVGQLFTNTIRETLQDGSGLVEKLYGWLFSLVSRLLKAIPDLLLFLLTSILSGFMLSGELPRLRKLWQKKAPPLWQQRYRSLLGRFRNTLGAWMKAQAKLMGITALVLTAGFLILKINYPLLFGLVIALIDALPALGTGLILIPWGLFMFLQGNSFLGAGLIVLYGAAALIRTALEPRLLGKQMGLDPLLTLLALYGGYRFFGIPGMILFPIGAIMVKQFWNHMENHAAD